MRVKRMISSPVFKYLMAGEFALEVIGLLAFLSTLYAVVSMIEILLY